MREKNLSIENSEIERKTKAFRIEVFNSLENLGLKNPTKEEIDLVEICIRKFLAEKRDADPIAEPIAQLLLHYDIHPFEVQRFFGDPKGRTLNSLYTNFQINQYIRKRLAEAREPK